MAYNFCNAKYGSTVFCTKPSSDNNPVDTLITGFNLSPNGFMVESFLRPPVFIYFDFCCVINIYKIIINRRVGRHSSNHIAVYSLNTNDGFSSVAEFKKCHNKSLKRDSLCYKPLMQVPEAEEDVVCIVNTKFVRDVESTEQSKLQPSVDRQVIHYRNSELMCASRLLIKINSVKDCSIPCLGWIEVWGRPSSVNKKPLLKDLASIQRNAMNCVTKRSPSIYSDRDKYPQLNTYVEIAENKSKLETNEEIPEEFLDSLTHQLMTNPMTLPSGNNIDMSSLNNFLKEEEMWHRKPADPFTAVPFTKERYPKPNDILKRRIDRFSLLNSVNGDLLDPDYAMNVSKGTKRVCPKILCNDTLPSVKKKRVGVPKSEIDKLCVSSSYVSGTNPSYSPISRSVLSQNSSQSKHSISQQSYIHSFKDNKTNFTNSSITSIPADLDNILDSFPSYLPQKSSSSCQQPPSSNLPDLVTCHMCSDVPNVNFLYRTSCSHSVCRTCLLSSLHSNFLRCKCGQLTKQSEIYKEFVI